jgi:glycerophosphoryl diester phosphodiesterase
MLEIDVFKIKTGEIVVFHDDDLDWLTNAKGKIESYSFDELRKGLLVETPNSNSWQVLLR